MAIDSTDLVSNSSSSYPSLPIVEDYHDAESFAAVERDPASWAQSQPADQGLYQNDLEQDSCGVGFICQIKGQPSHKIVSDARQLLCSMTHRGATGADSRDGDGAGVMTGIPHAFFQREAERDLGCTLPDLGHYAVGNVFFKPNDAVELQKQQTAFAKIASNLNLRVLGWRAVPTDGTILGPAASSKEPAIMQPFVVLRSHYGDGNASQDGPFDGKYFERQLYVLRKHATHTMFVPSHPPPRSSPPAKSFRRSIAHYIFIFKVLSPSGSTCALYLQRTLYTRGSCPLPRYTTTITISTMFCTVRTLRWFILVSLPIHSQAGTAPSPCGGRPTMVSFDPVILDSPSIAGKLWLTFRSYQVRSTLSAAIRTG